MKPSQTIIAKLTKCGGITEITLLNGDHARIAFVGSHAFSCDKLRYQEVDFGIFDIVYEFLSKNNGHAKKGGCRDSKVGYGHCLEGTVMYEIATQYYGKKRGESCFDPLFVIAAIMKWAGIASNQRGYMYLYRR